MKSERIEYRKRTKALIDSISTQPEEVQFQFFGTNDVSVKEEQLFKARRSFGESRFGYEVWDLIEKSSGNVMGTCGFHTWNQEHNRAEIGYHLWDDYQGKGYMSEALFQILNYGFEQMKLHRIEALTGTYNEASQALLRKLGFKEEGCLREHYLRNEVYEDSVVFSLLRSELT